MKAPDRPAIPPSSPRRYHATISLHVGLGSDNIGAARRRRDARRGAPPSRRPPPTARHPPPLVTVAANGRGLGSPLARRLLNSRSCPWLAAEWWRRRGGRGLDVQNAGVVLSADLVCVGHFG